MAKDSLWGWSRGVYRDGVALPVMKALMGQCQCHCSISRAALRLTNITKIAPFAMNS